MQADSVRRRTFSLGRFPILWKHVLLRSETIRVLLVWKREFAMNNSIWREAKDDMGRSVWLNMALARSIRRDPKGRSTLVTFDNAHAIAVDTSVSDLISETSSTTRARRPRDLD